MYCDLHCHSTFSDGSFTPTQLVDMAARRGLTLALTDHNITAGLPEFMEQARLRGVTAVAGVELSTQYERYELHLLGLFLTPENYGRVERLTGHFRVLKEICNMELVERLNQAGYHIDYPSVKARNPTGNANRAHVAAELMERGYVSSVRHAFQTILSEEAGFYVPPERLGLLEAISFLRRIRAVPVLAHPLQELTGEQLCRLLPQAVEAGLMGMEVYHSSYDRATHDQAVDIASRFDLLWGGGSDFHGTPKPTVELGCCRVPHQVYEQLLRAHGRL